MRQQPKRATAKNTSINERYTSGICRVYRLYDDARPGYQPKIKREFVCSLPYGERRIGISRYYQALQVKQSIDRLIRVPIPPCGISAQDEIELTDGRIYRVQLVQTVDGGYPPSADLTLKSLEGAK